MKQFFLFVLLQFPIFLIGQNSIPVLLSSKGANDIEFEEQKEVYSIDILGENPYIFSLPLDSEVYKENSQLSFQYFCPTGLDFIKFDFYSDNKVQSSKTYRDLGSTEGWVEFRLDVSEELKTWGDKNDFIKINFGGSSGINIRLKALQLRPLTRREKEIQIQKANKKAKEAVLEEHLKNYLDTTFEDQIENIIVSKNEVTITGKTRDSKQLFLAEVLMNEEVTEARTFHVIKPIENDDSFKISVPRTVRYDGYNYDRVLSKWILLKKNGENYDLASHARYCDSIKLEFNYSFLKPKTKKGLGGYSANREAPSSDLEDLGISSVTVNIWINGLFRSTPSNDNIPFEYLGKTFYIDKKELANYDQTFLNTSKRNIEVSAILLVAKASDSKDKEIGEILQHPDTDPAGIYAMPNMTSPEGVLYYSAIIDFLAKRYSRPDKKYGRIHNWIIHNEVDAGWVWTNAGDKTSLVFMDLYHKSMRLVYNIARKYNPNSKVFISLTHYWNWTSNPKFYHSRELLNQLLEFSHSEGNFEWAIAQHPYPESLRDPRTWEDEKVSFDFDTKLITFKNIEVLNEWVKQPKVLYKGKIRTVYLSENGTNSPTYSDQDLEEQAAGLAYALKKIKYLDAIKGFQYHNWQDNRREGGLRIGLRKFPDDQEDPGGKKPAWYVFEAFETPHEDSVFEKYKKIIGIDRWDEIRYKDAISKKKVQ